TEQSIAGIRAGAESSSLGTAFELSVRGLATGDWGTSISLRRPVRELVSERAGTTVRSLVAGILLAWPAAAAAALVMVGARWRGAQLATGLLSGAMLCLP